MRDVEQVVTGWMRSFDSEMTKLLELNTRLMTEASSLEKQVADAQSENAELRRQLEEAREDRREVLLDAAAVFPVVLRKMWSGGDVVEWLCQEADRAMLAEALAEKAQEPAAWLYDADGKRDVCLAPPKVWAHLYVPLYTAPPTIEAAEQAAAVKMQRQCAGVVRKYHQGGVGSEFDAGMAHTAIAAEEEIRAIQPETGALREMIAAWFESAYQWSRTTRCLTVTQHERDFYIDRILAGKGEVN